MATEPGKSGKISDSKGPWIEGDHHSIQVGGGAPPNGGDGKQSLNSTSSAKGSPTKDTNSGTL